MSNFLNGKVIDDYITVQAESVVYFDIDVNRLILSGYIPFGSPYSDGKNYCQAMIKFKDAG